MYFRLICFAILLVLGSSRVQSQELRLGYTENIGQNKILSRETTAAYSLGVHTGIINPAKYTLESFHKDERNVFKQLYEQYILLNDSLRFDYKNWLVMNNFGMISDTQESLLERNISKVSILNTKKNAFIKTVKMGDILITRRGIGGLVGHAAIMSSDYYVLEMPGGPGWARGIKNNNKQTGKDKWFDEHASDLTLVYRCPDSTVAREAAIWADHAYYNPSGGNEKTKHITYLITHDIWKIDPSYCSKLVIQAYYFGPGKKTVIRDFELIKKVIVPGTIPSYFLSPYRLIKKGRF